MICENGRCRALTPEEKAAAEHRSRLSAISERRRSMTMEEVSRLLIAQRINAFSVDDRTALRMKDYYPEWAPDVKYEIGFKVQRKSKLYRVCQSHTSQTGWEPESAPALWEQINEVYEGTLDDPIPYDGNMALKQGSHYIQNNMIYLCDRDTVNPVYHPLSDLVGLYVKEV